MKLFKKLLAVTLAGVLALSVLTGCSGSDAVSTASIVKALNDMGQRAGAKFSEGSAEKSKAQSVAKKLNGVDINDRTSTEGKAVLTSVLQELGVTVEAGTKPHTNDNTYLWLAYTKTKGMNTTAQAYQFYDGMREAYEDTVDTTALTASAGSGSSNEDDDSYAICFVPSEDAESKEPAENLKVGTATFKDAKGESYRLMVVTAEAKTSDNNQD